MKHVCSLGMALVLSFPVLADDLGGRADISYSEANPDYSPFPNGDGISLYARLDYRDTAFVYLRSTDAEFQPSGPVSGGNVKDWQEIGLGYHYGLSDQWSLEASASYQEIEQAGSDDNGHEFQLGVGFRPIEKLDLDLSLGALDLQINDWNLDFEARYHFVERFYIVTKLRDYADWDFTYYEAGLGVSF